MRRAIASFAALFLAAGLAPGGPLDGPKSTADIVEESEPSIALVKGKGSMGTGFLVRPGILVTNAHVIDDEFIAGLEVAFPSADEAKKGPYPAELLYEDRKRDLAVLAVKVDLPPLRVASSYTFRKGEDITIIGNPGVGGDVVLENAVSKGVLSTKAEIDGQKFYQLGISINPGNSGGPVFDSTGQVIGVATLKSAREEALAFSIPVEELRDALEKVAAQKPAEVEQARSVHRALAALKGLGAGGAIYSVGIDLKRVAATPAGASSSEVRAASQKIDAVIADLDKEAFPSITPEVGLIRKDSQLTPALKDKLGRLADNFGKLRTTYRAKPAELARDKGGQNLKQMKTRHRDLINELAKELEIDVPEKMMFAFDDRPLPPANALAQVIPGNPGTARPGPSSSLRQRMQERSNLPNRPGSRATTGGTLKDRMKARRDGK
jgi:S1-C subfamily serine protease